MSDEFDVPKQVWVDDRAYTTISIRSGGMGRVWLLEQAFEASFDPVYSRRLAVKTFDFSTNEDAVKKELNTWISLMHPFILPLKKIGRLNYRLAAIMPLLAGSLDDILKARGPFQEREVSRILSAMVDGLSYAWNKFGILHLDLKPSNVLLEDSSGLGIKIADWGISRLASDRRGNLKNECFTTSDDAFDELTVYSAGTPIYMSPERFLGSWSLSPVADIYSLGMMAIHLNTGSFPFSLGHVNPMAEILSGFYLENARLLLINRNKYFQRFCLSCINPNPLHRPNNYSDIAAMLKSIV